MGPAPIADPPFCSGGAGLWSTVDDYLRFARMLLAGGTLDGVRVLSEESVRLMRTDRLTDEQKRYPFLGVPFWVGRGFGLNLSVVTDPAKSGSCSARAGSAHSAGRAHTGRGGRPIRAADLILIYLIQNHPDLTSTPRRPSRATRRWRNCRARNRNSSAGPIRRSTSSG